MGNRYDIRRDQLGRWTVFDVFTGEPVDVVEGIMVAMSPKDADEMAELLNLQDTRRRAKAGKNGQK